MHTIEANPKRTQTKPKTKNTIEKRRTNEKEKKKRKEGKAVEASDLIDDELDRIENRDTETDTDGGHGKGESRK